MKKPLLVLVSIILFLGSIPFQSQATIHTVAVADFSFTPSTVQNVVVGDTVRFSWVSGSHTTTSTSVPTGAATWDRPINSGATTFDYRVTVAGNYSFHCSIHSNMTGDFTAGTGNTGVSAISAQETNLKFFPNPIKDDLNVSFNSAMEGVGTVRIYDLTGKEVYLHQTDITVGANMLTIPVANLQSGMYMAEVAIGTEQIGVRRIIKE